MSQLVRSLAKPVSTITHVLQVCFSLPITNVLSAVIIYFSSTRIASRVSSSTGERNSAVLFCEDQNQRFCWVHPRHLHCPWSEAMLQARRWKLHLQISQFLTRILPRLNEWRVRGKFGTGGTVSFLRLRSWKFVETKFFLHLDLDRINWSSHYIVRVHTMLY